MKKQLVLLSWMQIFFHGIFDRLVSIFVLWEVKEPKASAVVTENLFAGFHHWRLQGRVSSGRTLLTPLPPAEALISNQHLLFVQQLLQVSMKELWVGAFSKSLLLSLVEGVRCSPLHTQYSASVHYREALTDFCSLLVSKKVIGCHSFWKGSFGWSFHSMKCAILFLLLLNQPRILGSRWNAVCCELRLLSVL